MPKSYGDHRRFLDNSIATERDLVKRKLEYPELYQKQGEILVLCQTLGSRYHK